MERSPAFAAACWPLIPYGRLNRVWICDKALQTCGLEARAGAIAVMSVWHSKRPARILNACSTTGGPIFLNPPSTSASRDPGRRQVLLPTLAVQFAALLIALIFVGAASAQDGMRVRRSGGLVGMDRFDEREKTTGSTLDRIRNDWMSSSWQGWRLPRCGKARTRPWARRHGKLSMRRSRPRW